MAARRFAKKPISRKEASLSPEVLKQKVKAGSVKTKDLLKGQFYDVKITKDRRLDLVVTCSVGESFNVGQRLSDASMQEQVAATVKQVSGNRDAALRLLQDIGVATSTGRLSKRFGG